MTIEDYEQVLRCNEYKDKKDQERLAILESLLVRTKIQSNELVNEIKKIRKKLGED